MSDRYVIVHRCGAYSPPLDAWAADWACIIGRHNADPFRPAYRIRIREKAQVTPSCGNVFVDLGLGAFHPLPARLDATLAYRQTTGRDAPG